MNLSSSVDSIALRVTLRSKPINGRLRGRNVRSIAASDSSTVVGPFPKIEPRKQASGMAREMTGPSSLSARAPSIFVGANRPTAVCAITLGGRRTFRVSPNRSAFVRSFPWREKPPWRISTTADSMHARASESAHLKAR